MAGLTFTVKTTVDNKQITERITKEVKNVQGYFDAMVLADSNYFCPLKTGTLQKSAIINTHLGSGEIVWKTPYARRQYYEYSKPAYQPNPNACGRWFEAAKARWLDKWVRFINEQLKRS